MNPIQDILEKSDIKYKAKYIAVNFNENTIYIYTNEELDYIIDDKYTVLVDVEYTIINERFYCIGRERVWDNIVNLSEKRISTNCFKILPEYIEKYYFPENSLKDIIITHRYLWNWFFFYPILEEAKNCYDISKFDKYVHLKPEFEEISYISLNNPQLIIF